MMPSPLSRAVTSKPEPLTVKEKTMLAGVAGPRKNTHTKKENVFKWGNTCTFNPVTPGELMAPDFLSTNCQCQNFVFCFVRI